jgi:hypothetical protein
VEWKIDLHSFWFYFDVGREHRYILEVHQTLLDERSAHELIRELEENEWKRALQDHPGKIVRYSDVGFTFRDRR